MKRTLLLFFAVTFFTFVAFAELNQSNSVTLEKKVFNKTEKIKVSFAGKNHYLGWVAIYEDSQDIFSVATQAWSWDWTYNNVPGTYTFNNPGKEGRFFAVFRNGRTNTAADEVSDRVYFYITEDGTMPESKAVITLEKNQFGKNESKIKINYKINANLGSPWIAFYKENTDTHSVTTNAGTENINWKWVNGTNGSIELTNPGLGRWFVVLRNGNTGRWSDDISEYVYFDVVEQVLYPTVSVTKSKFMEGEEVIVSYTDQQGDSNDELMVFHNLSLLPLKKKGDITGANGNINLGSKLQPGMYRVFYQNANGTKGGEEITFEVEAQEYTYATNSKRIAVVSDVHIMAPEMVVKDGKAFQQYLIEDRKLLRESYDITKSVVEELIKEKLDLLIVPGDLTKDGELASHQKFVELFDKLRNSGTKILVVPGNHDVNNPDAVYFNGDEYYYAPTVSTEDFRNIYANYGYNNSYAYDPNSLSYANEPIPGLVVLGLDAAKYYDNTYIRDGARTDSCVTNGLIKPETLEWVKIEAKKAFDEGKQVIAFFHHNVAEHFDSQKELASPYILDNFEDVQNVLMDLGIRVAFTGHFHSTDIKRVNRADGAYLYDVETGATVTYPCPYRLIELKEDMKTMRIDTKLLKTTGEEYYTRLEGQSFQEHANSALASGIPNVMSWLVKQYYGVIKSKVPSVVTLPNADDLAKILVNRLSDIVVKLLLTHNEGNEQLKQGDVVQKELRENIGAAINDTFGTIIGPIALKQIKGMKEYDQIIALAKSMIENKIYNTSTPQLVASLQRVAGNSDEIIDDLRGEIVLKEVPKVTLSAKGIVQNMQLHVRYNNEKLHITLKNAKNNRISVYDINGKTLATFYTGNGVINEYQVFCPITTKGVYIVTVDNHSEMTQKIFVD